MLGGAEVSPFRPLRSFCTELRLSTYTHSLPLYPTAFPLEEQNNAVMTLGNPHGLGEGLGFPKENRD